MGCAITHLLHVSAIELTLDLTVAQEGEPLLVTLPNCCQNGVVVWRNCGHIADGVCDCAQQNSVPSFFAFVREVTGFIASTTCDIWPRVCLSVGCSHNHSVVVEI
jgi:hypothetical protein